MCCIDTYTHVSYITCTAVLCCISLCERVGVNVSRRSTLLWRSRQGMYGQRQVVYVTSIVRIKYERRIRVRSRLLRRVSST
jgi:hypothetical protein